MSQPTVSIISAGLSAMSEHFAATAGAVVGQSYGDFEWLIISDGTGESLDQVHSELSWLWGDPRVHHQATGIAGGAGVARTTALARARGKYVWVMDIDDLPAPDALGSLVAALETSGADWAQGVADDLTPGGLVKYALPEGIAGMVQPGQMRRFWEQEHRLAVHTVGMLIRREAVNAVGGWYGLPVGEDTGMVLAMSDQTLGVVVATTTLAYRKWAAQTTATDWFAATRALCHDAVVRRRSGNVGLSDMVGVCSVVRECDLVHIDEMHQSLAEQAVRWQWYLAAGPSEVDVVRSWASCDPRIVVVETAPVGTRALSKNLALAAAQEEVVVCVDPFDSLGIGVLGELHGAVAEGAAYATARATDVGGVCGVGPGRVIEPGELVGAWRGDPTRWPVLSSVLATTATRLWQVGGHPAVSISEDAYLAALLGQHEHGVVVPGNSVRHRPWLLPHARALTGPGRMQVRAVDQLMFSRAG